MTLARTTRQGKANLLRGYPIQSVTVDRSRFVYGRTFVLESQRVSVIYHVLMHEICHCLHRSPSLGKGSNVSPTAEARSLRCEFDTRAECWGNDQREC